jgi:hypothetical protein
MPGLMPTSLGFLKGRGIFFKFFLKKCPFNRGHPLFLKGAFKKGRYYRKSLRCRHRKPFWVERACRTLAIKLLFLKNSLASPFYLL